MGTLFKKIKDNYYNYRWIVVFLMIFPFLKINHFRIITFFAPIYNYSRWFIVTILFVFFFFIKKKKPSKLWWIAFAMELTTLVVTYFINKANCLDCFRNCVSVLFIGLFIEYFIDDKNNLLNGLLFSFEVCIYPNLITLLKYIKLWKYTDANNFLGQHNLYVLYFIPAIFIGLIYCKMMKNKNRAYALVAAVIISTIISKCTTAYITVIGLLISLLVMNKAKKRENITNANGWSIFALLLNVFTIRIFPYLTKHEVIQKLFKFFGSSDTFSGRTPVWDDALKMIKIKPLFGYGFGSLTSVIDSKSNQLHAHNELLQRIMDSGVFGLMLFLLFNITVIRKINTINDRTLKCISIACMFSIFLVYIVEALTNMYIFYIVYFIIYNLDKLQNNHETC